MRNIYICEKPIDSYIQVCPLSIIQPLAFIKTTFKWKYSSRPIFFNLKYYCHWLTHTIQIKLNVWDNNAAVARAAERGKAKETEFKKGQFRFSLCSAESMKLLWKDIRKTGGEMLTSRWKCTRKYLRVLSTDVQQSRNGLTHRDHMGRK